MGIYIYLQISHSVTKEEWEKVYEETLQLVNAFPFAEKRRIKCKGIDTVCLVKTKERKVVFQDWNGNKEEIGWWTIGDYETMSTAEDYSLQRDLVEDDKINADAIDILLGQFLEWDGENVPPYCYYLWGNKTQGEPYHIYLLAIACMIESRLKGKVLVNGDITRGQCKKAVQLANRYLSEPIDVPDICDIQRLAERVSKFPMSESKQLEALEHFYLGTKDKEFGECIQRMFSEDAVDNYWKNRLEKSYIGTVGFSRDIKQYFLWGFDLQKLCRLVNFEKKEDSYASFIKDILDTKLYQKEKDCSDMLEIDQEASSTYSIATLMAQVVFMGARNDKVDRYIPIDEIRRVLNCELGTKCNVDVIIDEYLEKERIQIEQSLKKQNNNMEDASISEGQTNSELFKQMMNRRIQRTEEKRQKYNISEYDDLPYYETGDTVSPEMEEVIGKSYLFYHNSLQEDWYKNLMQQSAKERCQWLVEQNRTLLMRDKDWKKIFTDIFQNEDFFERYYPMVRVNCNIDGLVYLVRSFVLNDDLYEYAKEISKNSNFYK